MRSSLLSDDLIDVDILDVTTLPLGDVAVLGDSVLGHAVRRRLTHGTRAQDVGPADAIAAHDSHV
jgi:hypothetical protein